MLAKINRSLAIFMLIFSFGCETAGPEDVPQATTNPATSNTSTNSSAKPTPASVKPSAKASPTSAPSSSDDINLDVSKPGEPDEKEIVGTDKEAVKSNIDWKQYYPVVKGKKYVYLYTMKEKDSTIQTDINWEIIAAQDKDFTIRQSFSTSGANKLTSSDIKLTLNNDFSPPIVPIVAVAGEKIDSAKKIQITETPEKIKVPFKELDAVKVVIDSGTVTNWYSKDIGLIKSISISTQGTYTLELKDYK